MYIGRGHIQNGLRFPLLRCKYHQIECERRNHYTYYIIAYTYGGYSLYASMSLGTDI